MLASGRLGDEYISGFDVSMHQPRRMIRIEGRRNLSDDIHRPPYVEPAIA